MANGVFTAGVESIYDDLPEVKYHFPHKYLKMVERCLHDWILYYEPRRGGGRLSYFATARVDRIERDPIRNDHYYAYVTDYLPFPHPVPYRNGDIFYESKLRKEDGTVNKGWLGWAVRTLEKDEYQMILTLGMGNKDILSDTAVEGLLKETPIQEYNRPIIEQVSRRPYRDRVFSKVVRTAYDNKCAFTGLHLVNGGGRTEVEAAHIMAVEDMGPDSIRNGLALSRTVHWMFDRGIISLEDNGKILKADRLIPEQMNCLLNADGYINLPANRRYHPHSNFLRFHREHRFRG